VRGGGGASVWCGGRGEGAAEAAIIGARRWEWTKRLCEGKKGGHRDGEYRGIDMRGPTKILNSENSKTV
jgi:hypothetical protein